MAKKKRKTASKRKVKTRIKTKTKMKKVRLPADTVLQIAVPKHPVVVVSPDHDSVAVIPADAVSPELGRSWVDYLFGTKRRS
jgi:hypothetical protein